MGCFVNRTSKRLASFLWYGCKLGTTAGLASCSARQSIKRPTNALRSVDATQKMMTQLTMSIKTLITCGGTCLQHQYPWNIGTHKCANYSGKARNMVDVAPARGETGGAVRDVGAAAEELGAPAEELGAAAEETRAAAEGAEDAEAVP